jgi:MFS family permease
VSVPAPAPGLSAVVRWLVLAVAAIGFLFDTYELLMFPVIGSDAIGQLVWLDPAQGANTRWWIQLGFGGGSDLVRGTPPGSAPIAAWSGRMLWIAALAGGAFGLLGGFMVDRFGRKTVMVGSILLYSLSPVAAATSTELWQFVLFRCTTFVGVCVEAVAAVAWLAELFADRRQRERAIGWTLAFASLGGILVTEVFNEIVAELKANPGGAPWLSSAGVQPAAWRYTLLTGLVPGALILVLMPFVPESRVWKERKAAGTLKRPSLGELFSPALRRTTVVTTLISACGYAAAFGALQLGPLVMAAKLPAVEQVRKEAPERIKEAGAGVKGTKPGTPERVAAEKALDAAKAAVPTAINEKRGNMQRWQEIGGLVGRILFAVLVVYVASRLLIRLFLLPGLVLFPLTYLVLYQGDYTAFAVAVFFCGLVTVAQFSYVSEYLPKVFPIHLRGTGSGFATNVGGRMLGTMAALLNTELIAPLFLPGQPPELTPLRVASAAAVIGVAVYAVALALSFLLPEPREDEALAPPAVPPGPSLPEG